jgi:hypothetical protein
VLGSPALLIVSALQAPQDLPCVHLARWTVVIWLIAANNVVITMVLAMVIFRFSPHDAIPWARRSAASSSSVPPSSSG